MAQAHGAAAADEERRPGDALLENLRENCSNDNRKTHSKGASQRRCEVRWNECSSVVTDTETGAEASAKSAPLPPLRTCCCSPRVSYYLLLCF